MNLTPNAGFVELRSCLMSALLHKKIRHAAITLAAHHLREILDLREQHCPVQRQIRADYQIIACVSASCSPANEQISPVNRVGKI